MPSRRFTKKKIDAYKAWRRTKEGRPGCEMASKVLADVVAWRPQDDKVRRVMNAAYKCLEPPSIVAKREPRLVFLDRCIDPNDISQDNVRRMKYFVDETNRVWISNLFTKFGRRRTGIRAVNDLLIAKGGALTGLDIVEELLKQKRQFDASHNPTGATERSRNIIAFIREIATSGAAELRVACEGMKAPVISRPSFPQQHAPPKPTALTASALTTRSLTTTDSRGMANPFLRPSHFFRSLPMYLPRSSFGGKSIVSESADPYNQKKNGMKWVSKTLLRTDDGVWQAIESKRHEIHDFTSFYNVFCRVIQHLEKGLLKRMAKWWEWVSAILVFLNGNKIPIRDKKLDGAAFLYAFQFFHAGTRRGSETLQEPYIEIGKSSYMQPAHKTEPTFGRPLNNGTLRSFGIPIRVATGPKNCVPGQKWVPLSYDQGGGGMGSSDSSLDLPSVPTHPVVSLRDNPGGEKVQLLG